MDWVLGRMVVLSKGLTLQKDAREAITAYGHTMKLDVEQLCLSFGKKDCSQALSIGEYRDEDDDEYEKQVDAEDKVDDEAVDEDEDESQYEYGNESVLDDAGENDVTIHVDTEASAVCLREQVRTSLSHFTVEVCNKVISPLSKVISNRISTTAVSSESFFPLTSRSVERVFSSWKRMMDRNAGTKPCTMHALVLLSPFDFATTIKILQESPLTDTITKYLNRIKSQNPEKELNSKAYHKLLEKRNALAKKKELTLIFTDLRKQLSVSAPPTGKTSISSLWTMKHSKEYFDVVGLHVENLTKMSAIEMRDRVLQHSHHAHLASNALETLPPIDQQLKVTHVLDVETDTYEVERVIGHRIRTKKKKKIFQYRVMWVGFDEPSDWMVERDFVGLTLCDYWKDQVEEKRGIKKAALDKKITHILDSGDNYVSENDVDKNDSYIIVCIEDHELSLEGTMFYKVLWAGKGGGTDWVPENSFDNDVILSEYWKKEYYNALHGQINF
jgi:hypothetical protein